jgi:hypothetical protein
LDASKCEKVLVLNERFHRVTPVPSSLKSVDGLGAVGTRKRSDFWGQILELHTVRVQQAISSKQQSSQHEAQVTIIVLDVESSYCHHDDSVAPR